jgi:hypothetical protein
MRKVEALVYKGLETQVTGRGGGFVCGIASCVEPSRRKLSTLGSVSPGKGKTKGAPGGGSTLLKP